ncbi:unnamed protein product [Cylindrotheca closterium]|uniref:Integrase catalytic domain-containing protein n=1 Tax=Cylindrotheca closterium TaxID=2856 RepID=A0AAD2CX22_9STRA|nr:unnamed protein product [Cylindrotheca closterium]
MQTGSADRSGGPQPRKQKIDIQGWNMAQFGGRKRVPQPILRPARFGTSPPQDIMANWQVQLDAVRAAEEDVSVASTQSSNVQVGREVAVMHSQAHRGLRYKDSGNLVYLDSNDYKDGKIPEHFDTHDPKWFRSGATGPSLDTGSTFHLRKDSMNAKMGTLKELPYMFNYGTNVGGGRNLTHEVESKHMNNMCKYDADAICDVDSASLLVKEGYRIVMDTDVENAFIVSKDGNQWIYREKDGLYTYEPHKGESHCNVCMEIGWTGEACRSCRAHSGFVPGVSYHGGIDNTTSQHTSRYSGLQTVKKNIEGYTPRQVDQANAARSGYHMGGAPGIEAFKVAVCSGLFKNCPIREEDIVIADKIYGPSASVLKGKTKRPTPEAVWDDWVEIPHELLVHNVDLNLHLDIAFINTTFGLTTIDGSIRYQAFVPLRSRTAESLCDAIDHVLRIYNHADFTIKTIYCDGEFRPVFDDVKDEMNVDMNYASRGEHDPTAERNNQHIKALFRVQYHCMPYKAIPRIITEAIAKRVAQTSNFYPSKGGISAYYSPHMILLRRQVDYSKEFVAELGSYVHGYGHDTRSDHRSCTIEAIYLGPADNMQKGHKLYDLNTKREVTRPQIMVLPITDQVIKLIEAHAAEEGVTDLQTYSRRNGEIILDAALLAGVDPDELWDEDYVPADIEIPSVNDMNLRKKDAISDEELEELIEDAAEDILESRRIDDKRQHEYDEADRTVDRMLQRIKRRQEEEDEEDMDFVQDQQPESDIEMDIDDEELKDMIDEVARELDRLSQPIEEEIMFSVEDDDNDYEGEYDAEEIEELQEAEDKLQVYPDEEDDVRAGVRFEEVPVLSTTDDSNKDKKRRTRSGPSFYSNRVKYRPTDRNRTDRPRHGQTYLQQKKPKINLLKNRSKYQAIGSKVKSRKKGEFQDDNVLSTEAGRKITEWAHNLMFQQNGTEKKATYNVDESLVISRIMQQICDEVYTRDGVSFIQQYYLNKGLKIFKEWGKEAALKELDQLIKRSCWTPISNGELTESEKRKAVDAMMLLAEKNSGDIKGRFVYKGNETRDCLS